MRRPTTLCGLVCMLHTLSGGGAGVGGGGGGGGGSLGHRACTTAKAPVLYQRCPAQPQPGPPGRPATIQACALRKGGRQQRQNPRTQHLQKTAGRRLMAGACKSFKGECNLEWCSTAEATLVRRPKSMCVPAGLSSESNAAHSPPGLAVCLDCFSSLSGAAQERMSSHRCSLFCDIVDMLLSAPASCLCRGCNTSSKPLSAAISNSRTLDFLPPRLCHSLACNCCPTSPHPPAPWPRSVCCTPCAPVTRTRSRGSGARPDTRLPA